MDMQEIGLRERKRQATRHSLKMATIKLVTEQGLDNTTIDMICELSGVSKRTFFNYFDSKEDAILGVHDFNISDQSLRAVAERYKDQDKMASVVGLMIGIIGPNLADPSSRCARMEVIHSNPELLQRQLSRMTKLTQQFRAAIEKLFQLQNHQPVSSDQAEILLAAAGSAIRIVIRRQAESDQDLTLPELEQEIIKLIRGVIDS